MPTPEAELHRFAAPIVAATLTLWSTAMPSTAGAQEPQQEPQQSESEEQPPPHNDGRRTWGQLPKNLGRTTVGVFSGANLAPFLVGGAAAAGASLLDEGTANPDGGDNSFGRAGATAGGAGAAVAALTMLAVGRSSDSQGFRDASYDVAVAASVNFLYTAAIKAAVDRTRPNGSSDQSFLSGHTSNAFAWAAVIEGHYGPKAGIPMYALASMIGISRVAGGHHYLSDVVAGAALGFIIGKTTIRRDGEPLGEPRLSLVPTVGPSGQRGVVAVIRF